MSCCSEMHRVWEVKVKSIQSSQQLELQLSTHPPLPQVPWDTHSSRNSTSGPCPSCKCHRFLGSCLEPQDSLVGGFFPFSHFVLRRYLGPPPPPPAFPFLQRHSHPLPDQRVASTTGVVLGTRCPSGWGCCSRRMKSPFIENSCCECGSRVP